MLYIKEYRDRTWACVRSRGGLYKVYNIYNILLTGGRK